MSTSGGCDRLRLRARWALGVVAITALVSHITLEDRISRQRDDAYRINRAGLQRMLTMRITAEARGLASARAPERIAAPPAPG